MVSTISSIAIALSLIFYRIHGSPHLSLAQLRQQEYHVGNYGPVSGESQTNARQPISIAWKWPFNLEHLPGPELSDQKMSFPGIMVISARSRAETVPECENQTYCADVSYYPSELVDRFLKNHPQFRNYENRDKMDEVIGPRTSLEDNITLCPSVEEIVYPKTGKIDDGTWKYILNTPNFIQGVRVETCKSKSESCRVIHDHTHGFNTTCEQKYIYRQLYVSTPNGVFTQESIPFPASCCCHVEYTGLHKQSRRIGPRSHHLN